MDNDYKECKFYSGKCRHEDCPPNTSVCIGKNNCGSWGDDLSHLKPPDINDAQHPARQKATKILEAIAEKLGNENIFDNASQNRKDEPDGTWYEYEDMVTNIIAGGENQ